jgi:hypothetical protein
MGLQWVCSGIVSSILLVAALQAQAPALQTDPLVDSIVSECDLGKKQEYLERWLAKEPQQGTDAIVDAAKLVLIQTPQDFAAQYTLVSLTPWTLQSTSEGMLHAAAAAKALLDKGMEIQFAAANRPENVSIDDWQEDHLRALAIAHRTLGWIAMQRGDHMAAERHFLESLEIYPNSPLVSAWLGKEVMAQHGAAKMELALFSFARAAGYEGDGALPDRARRKIDAYLSKVYTAYTGTDEGLAALKEIAKTRSLPSSDLKIDSAEVRRFADADWNRR